LEVDFLRNWRYHWKDEMGGRRKRKSWRKKTGVDTGVKNRKYGGARNVRRKF
jgi:hypothetical protein